jgi:ABC-type polysaccharide/polyol phosphate export permease
MPYLITGIIVWQYTATCFNDALHAITGNSNLIKKARFPRLLLPLAMVLANAFNFLLTLLVLLAYLAFTRPAFGRSAGCRWPCWRRRRSASAWRC